MNAGYISSLRRYGGPLTTSGGRTTMLSVSKARALLFPFFSPNQPAFQIYAEGSRLNPHSKGLSLTLPSSGLA